jgi:hypothetical protein
MPPAAITAPRPVRAPGDLAGAGARGERQTLDLKIRDGKVKAVVDYPLPLVRASCYLLRLNPAWM